MAEPAGTSSIALRGLQVQASHGVYEYERQTKQPFLVDIVANLSTRRAAATDDLKETLNYGQLAEETMAIMTGSPVMLIETLAERIADQVLTHPIVDSVEVTVHKPNAPIRYSFEDVAVKILRVRGGARGNVTTSIPRVAVTADLPEGFRAARGAGVISGMVGGGIVSRRANLLQAERVVLSLGGNLGDIPLNLSRAVALLMEIPGFQINAVSPLVATRAVLAPGQGEMPNYGNIVVLGRTALEPRELLAHTQNIENIFGRDRSQIWAARQVDIDLVAVGEQQINTPDLVLPHPRAAVRAFVLYPWYLVEPNAQLLGMPIAGLLEVAPDRGGILGVQENWLHEPGEQMAEAGSLVITPGAFGSGAALNSSGSPTGGTRNVADAMATITSAVKAAINATGSATRANAANTVSAASAAGSSVTAARNAAKAVSERVRIRGVDVELTENDSDFVFRNLLRKETDREAAQRAYVYAERLEQQAQQQAQQQARAQAQVQHSQQPQVQAQVGQAQQFAAQQLEQQTIAQQDATQLAAQHQFQQAGAHQAVPQSTQASAVNQAIRQTRAQARRAAMQSDAPPFAVQQIAQQAQQPQGDARQQASQMRQSAKIAYPGAQPPSQQIAHQAAIPGQAVQTQFQPQMSQPGQLQAAGQSNSLAAQNTSVQQAAQRAAGQPVPQATRQAMPPAVPPQAPQGAMQVNQTAGQTRLAELNPGLTARGQAAQPTQNRQVSGHVGYPGQNAHTVQAGSAANTQGFARAPYVPGVSRTSNVVNTSAANTGVVPLPGLPGQVQQTPPHLQVASSQTHHPQANLRQQGQELAQSSMRQPGSPQLQAQSRLQERTQLGQALPQGQGGSQQQAGQQTQLQPQPKSHIPTGIPAASIAPNRGGASGKASIIDNDLFPSREALTGGTAPDVRTRQWTGNLQQRAKEALTHSRILPDWRVTQESEAARVFDATNSGRFSEELFQPELSALNSRGDQGNTAIAIATGNTPPSPALGVSVNKNGQVARSSIHSLSRVATPNGTAENAGGSGYPPPDVPGISGLSAGRGQNQSQGQTLGQVQGHLGQLGQQQAGYPQGQVQPGFAPAAFIGQGRIQSQEQSQSQAASPAVIPAQLNLIDDAEPVDRPRLSRDVTVRPTPAGQIPVNPSGQF